MNPENIAAIGQLIPPLPPMSSADASQMSLPALSTSAAPTAATAFGQMVSQGISNVNQQMLVAQTDLQQLATGNTENLHQVMIRMEETRLAFQLLVQVRNRAMEAYQEVMKMQV